jgi:hypothetical protein
MLCAYLLTKRLRAHVQWGIEPDSDKYVIAADVAGEMCMLHSTHITLRCKQTCRLQWRATSGHGLLTPTFCHQR